MNGRKQLDATLAQWQSRLPASGPRYWRSLDELAEREEFQALVKQEFPEQADVWPDALSRRKFLALMAASLALGGINGCSVRPAPAEKIVPYVHPQETITPGRPLFFATTMAHGGEAVGLLVESHMGRPTKIEGNPDHPASRGATDAFHQASVLMLYDPDRSQTVTYEGQIRAWSDAERALREAMRQQRSSGGAGLRILTEPNLSPTLGWQLERLLGDFPQAKWHQWAPVNSDNGLRGAELAFGRSATPKYDFTKAEVVLSLDADFLAMEPGHLRYARDFMDRRRLPIDKDGATTAAMSRLYVVETAVTCTGAKADHRFALRGGDIELLARAIAAELGIGERPTVPTEWPKWVTAVGADLQANRGRCLVLAGRRQPPVVHLVAHAINERLGNAGQTVRYVPPAAARPVDCALSQRELADDMGQGRVETLIILGGNPAYNAPVDLQFGELLSRVPVRFHLSLHANETSQLCQWHLPEAHYLESWGDARGIDGTASLVQPLIKPLYGGRTAHELIALLSGGENVEGRETVRSYWREQRSALDEDAFEDWWETSLHDGVIADSAFEAESASLRNGWQEALNARASGSAGASTSNKLEIAFDADPTIFDGSFANNGWLQELPKPLTKLTWDNAAIMSPRTAAELKLQPGAFAHGGEHGGYEVPVVELRLGDRAIQAPVWIMPGHANGAVTVHLGYGRTRAGRIGGDQRNRVGFDAFALRSSEQPWFASDLEINATGRRYKLACTQSHHALDGRDVVRGGALDEYRKQPNRWKETHPENSATAEARTTLYPPLDQGQPRHKWAMLIDMTTCTGCSACVVACQAENNIPVVGKDQVLFGREMHWLRIDRYVSGPADEPEAYHFQPLPCMHCEHAPCEYVCPVAATVHSADGLNDMVYNRCVGTRFCSNNCPYKVRRFNFLAYSDYSTPARRLQYNPDVTVRSRGVMEKCTYCVQRIRAAEIDAEAAGRALADGEVLTACQAVCPTQAILFGDLNDANSRLARAKQSPLEYGLLAELNTFPRTTYLAEVRNPNPSTEAS